MSLQPIQYDVAGAVRTRLARLPAGTPARSDSIDGAATLRRPQRDELTVAASVLQQVCEEDGIRSDALSDLDLFRAATRRFIGAPGKARSDATTGFALEGRQQYGGRIIDPRERSYSVLGVMPVVTVPAGTEYYTKRFRNVTVAVQEYQSGDAIELSAQGKVDESAPRYIPSFAASYTIDKDWLGSLMASARTEHIGPTQMAAAARRAFAGMAYRLMIDGSIRPNSGLSLSDITVGYRETSSITYGGSGVTVGDMVDDIVAAAHRFTEAQAGYTPDTDGGTPYVALMPRRVLNRIQSASNYDAGGSDNGLAFAMNALADIGFQVIPIGRDLRGLGLGSTADAPVDRVVFMDAGDAQRTLARVQCLEPTIVDTYTERGKRVVVWGARYPGLDIVDQSLAHFYDVLVEPNPAGPVLPDSGE